MKINHMKILSRSGILLALVSFFTQSALATLGENETLIQNKAKSLGYAVSNPKPHGSGKRYELKLAGSTGDLSGDNPTMATKVQEYVSSAGTVYAIGWVGPNQPDLSSLLGEYATEFKTAKTSAQGKRYRLPFRRIKSDRLQIHVTKRAGVTRGYVYILGAIPDDVAEKELR